MLLASYLKLRVLPTSFLLLPHKIVRFLLLAFPSIDFLINTKQKTRYMNKQETILRDVRLWLAIISAIVFITMIVKSYPVE